MKAALCWSCLALLPAVVMAPFATSAEPVSLMKPDEEAVTFILKDDEGNTPQLALFDAADQRETADSINFWRGTPGVIDAGVAVQFKGLRFLRDAESPELLVVRLVGIKNELELTGRLPLADLQSGKPQRLRFGPVAIGAGVVTGTTDAEMLLAYNAQLRTLHIPEISGQFEWKRLFRDPQSDSGALSNVKGEVGEVPPGGAILKAEKK